MENIIKVCPFCNEEYVMEVTEGQYEKYKEYERGGQYIQELFPDLNAVEREFLKTGMCLNCQGDIFMNNKSDKIKPLWEEQ